MEVTLEKKVHTIFDPLYGLIALTPVEWEIIHSPFYQRLRWIRQLGFSGHVFHGAEHSRFGHSIGVMFNAHQILKALKRDVPENLLMEGNYHQHDSKDTLYHQSLRLGALLHDLGTFPFSHTTEMAYIRFGHTINGKKNHKGRSDDHEHLGSFIIKNTNFPGGITQILLKYGIDPQNISDLVKGIGPSILANQILHSEIDCDRMDYLLRDAHYTGLQYGTYDRDYLLHHFKVATVSGHSILCIHQNALHCIEDFLNSRFAWYSQVVRSARGAKFDCLAEELAFYLLEKNYIWKYGELMEMIENEPMHFLTFNDNYFMTQIHQLYMQGKLDANLKMKDMAHSLLLTQSPKIVKCEEFMPRLLNQDEEQKNLKIIKRALDKVELIQSHLAKKGGVHDWIVPDIPTKHIEFVKSHKRVVKSLNESGPVAQSNLLLQRDPVKIYYDYGEVKLLTEVENSTMAKLQNTFNFVPNLYCSNSAYEILLKDGLTR